MMDIALQIVDNFLLQYNVGQALLLLLIVSVLGALPLKSMKLVGLTLLTFGAIFVLTPSSMAPIHYKFLGVGLIFVGPMILVASRK
ncbi:hypothetical protein [Halorubellus sp. PRR65]|uniref:hypothetical protein n=1 Tax=Halorubellus sp. PRR65 TaxID=3098148 RepID=UPI002B25BD02|nr:hypothetical protein [Halorubellus sp. PRR65]